MTIDEIYLKIAQDIYDAIEGEWSLARLTFEYDEGAGEFESVYKKDVESNEELSFDVGYDTFNAFHELYRITTEGQESKWTKAIFTLYPTGEFGIDFER